jgi:hypothetical protein
MAKHIALVLFALGTSVHAHASWVMDYDAALCVTAQRIIVNASGDEFPVLVEQGVGNGFHTIQMDVDAEAALVKIAMTTGTVNVAGEADPLATHVACKMVNRQRINDVLGLELPGPDRSCRVVNEHTYRRALAMLSVAERDRFRSAGRPLEFADDYLAASGGEWLPAVIDAFIQPVNGDAAQGLEIRAPAVRVPWDSQQRQFFQGTQHCKLITMAAMQRWMRDGAFGGGDILFPRAKPACTAPSSMTSSVGSCLFYFAPADSMYCQDYSGPDWAVATAQAECGNRHASPEALRASDNRYDGAGGIYSAASCTERDDVPPLAGTCVFRCNDGDEALWHVTGSGTSTPGAAQMMSRACDLFIAR